MKFIPFLIFVFSCSPMEMKMSEDVVSGELGVIEKLAQDLE